MPPVRCSVVEAHAGSSILANPSPILTGRAHAGTRRHCTLPVQVQLRRPRGLAGAHRALVRRHAAGPDRRAQHVPGSQGARVRARWLVERRASRVRLNAPLCRPPDAPSCQEPFATVPYFWTNMFGKGIRYCGHALSFDDVIIQGDVNSSFIAYYVSTWPAGSPRAVTRAVVHQAPARAAGMPGLQRATPCSRSPRWRATRPSRRPRS